MKNKSTQMNMLQGNLWLQLIQFAMPLAAGMIIQQLFNAADVAVAGRFAGSGALAAVGSNTPVISLFVNTLSGLAVGANVVVARMIGQRDFKNISKAVHTIVGFFLVLGFFLVGLGLVIAPKILELIGTNQDVFSQAVVYLRIYFIGMPFIVLYNSGSAILRSVGDTKRPLYILIGSGILNVLLNLFFVIVIKMGVAGVACATTISNGFSCICVLYLLIRDSSEIHLDIRKIRIDKKMLLQILRVGIPSAFQGMVFSLSNVCIQSGINSFGSSAVAGSSTALTFEYFTYYIANAFGQAAVTFTSQNFGAVQYQRCKQIFRISMIEGMVFTAMLCAVFCSATDFWLHIYTNQEEIVEFAKIRMYHVVMLEALTCLFEVSGSALRGIGYSLIPAVLTVIGSVVFRIIWLVTVFRWQHNFAMLMNVYPVSWIFTAIMVLTAYFIVRSKILRGSLKNGT